MEVDKDPLISFNNYVTKETNTVTFALHVN